MNSRLGLRLLLVLCVAVWATSASAQETINYASVSGRVSDPQGMFIPGASVVAHQVATNTTADTLSDASGRFRFPYLRWARTKSPSRCPVSRRRNAS